MNINLLPAAPTTQSQRNVRRRFAQVLRRALTVRGCTAYWTITPRFLGQRFWDLLAREGSFFCVDVHPPTSLAALEQCYYAGASQLCLHLKKLDAKNPYRLPRYLLHAKMLLFDLPDGEAEIWIGSHNMTVRALSGINVEAATVVTCSQQDAFYQQTAAFLADVRQQCSRFDPTQMDAYEALQNQQVLPPEEPEWELQLVTEELASLQNTNVLLLSTWNDDILHLRTEREPEPIVVQVLTMLNGQRTSQLYRAEVESSGLVRESNPQSAQVGFSSRPYATRRYPVIPFVGKRSRAFAPGDLRPFACWANIVIGEPLGAAITVPPAPRAREDWYPVEHVELEEEFVRRDGVAGHRYTRRADEAENGQTERRILQAAIADPMKHSGRSASFSEMRALPSLEAAYDHASPSQVQQFFEREFRDVYFTDTDVALQRRALLAPQTVLELPPNLSYFRCTKLFQRVVVHPRWR